MKDRQMILDAEKWNINRDGPVPDFSKLAARRLEKLRFNGKREDLSRGLRVESATRPSEMAESVKRALKYRQIPRFLA